MEENKGFTLIELLAVIVILAIIALISTPIIIGVIEKARKEAFENSTYGVLDAGKLYFTDKLADDNQFEGATFTFPDGGDLTVSGEKPAGGSLVLDSTGKQALAIYDKDKKWCAYKTFGEEKVTIQNYEEENCQNPVILVGASKFIVEKNTEDNTEGLFTDDFGNVRYKGANPKNYVTFSNEVWRIIGIFDGKIKLIRAERISNPNDGSLSYNANDSFAFKWGTRAMGTGDEAIFGKNDWLQSPLQQYLNGPYYSSLTMSAQKMIGTETYYLGGLDNTVISSKHSYSLEKGTNVYDERPVKWKGKIGLPYPSDYGYATEKDCRYPLADYINEFCKTNDWLYTGLGAWFITPMSSLSYAATVISENGGVTTGAVDSTWWNYVHPTVYLKPTVKITSGDGTSSNSYQLSM